MTFPADFQRTKSMGKLVGKVTSRDHMATQLTTIAKHCKIACNHTMPRLMTAPFNSKFTVSNVVVSRGLSVNTSFLISHGLSVFKQVLGWRVHPIENAFK